LPAVVELSAAAAVLAVEEVSAAVVPAAMQPVVQPAEQLALQEEGQV